VEDQPAVNPLAEGEIVDSNGRVLGRHRGIHRYTIGQRRGLGIAHSKPLYVIDLLPDRNRVVVGERSEAGVDSCRVVRPNWISIPAISGPIRAFARIRSRHREAAVTITPEDDGSLNVKFETPQVGVSPGQACVFYEGEGSIGGGWIARSKHAEIRSRS
jgi:tRNA-specific 2-thiouridylase